MSVCDEVDFYKNSTRVCSFHVVTFLYSGKKEKGQHHGVGLSGKIRSNDAF